MNQDEELVKNETTATETIPQVESTAPPAEEDVNWKKFREERAADRKRREEAEAKAAKSEQEAAALKAAMDSLLNKPAHQQESDPDFDDEEMRIQKKIEAALAARDRQYQQQRQQEEQTNLPNRLKQSFRDFDQVCSTENLDYLEYHHPAIAKSFATMPDGFDKWAGVYDAVKKLIPNSDAKKNAEKAERNLNKPGAMAKGGMTQTGDAPPAYLDKARRQANWERMNRIIKGS